MGLTHPFASIEPQKSRKTGEIRTFPDTPAPTAAPLNKTPKKLYTVQ
jgi:hypothetical protein